MALSHVEINKISQSAESNTTQLKNLGKGFQSYFDSRGYGFKATRSIINPDRNLLQEPEFTVDHLCHLKTEILEEKLPYPGEASEQDCLRTQNLYTGNLDKHVAQGTPLPFCLAFRMLSVTTPGTSENIIADGWEYLVKEAGLKPDDIIIKISERDTELMEALVRNGVPQDRFFIMKETISDSNKAENEREAIPSYFNWDYGKASGFENIYGRGLTFAVHTAEKEGYTDIGNLISIKNKSDGRTIAWEYGFGLEVLSSTLKGEPIAVRSGEVGDLVKRYNDGNAETWTPHWDAVSDCVVGAANIFQAGIRTEGDSRGSRILKDILNKAAQVGIGVGLTSDDIAVMIADYSKLRYPEKKDLEVLESTVNKYYNRHGRETGKNAEEIINSMVKELAGKPGMDILATGVLGLNRYELPIYALQSVSDIRKMYSQMSPDEIEKQNIQTATAGRVLSHRLMGKVLFLTVGLPGNDTTIQVMINVQEGGISNDQLKDIANSLKNGDWIECKGQIIKTKTGELTLHASEAPHVLTPALIPAVGKYTNGNDVEGISTLEAEKKMIGSLEARANLNKSLRKDLDDLGFTEVETPIIEDMAGGASAAPFYTYINALKKSGVLRIAPELKLKVLLRLKEKIFEMGKSFRNEGKDRQHNPEFSMIEGYMSYGNAYKDLIPLMQKLIKNAAQAVNGNTIVTVGENTIDLSQEWRQISFRNLLIENAQIDIDPIIHLPEEIGKGKLKKILDARGLVIEGFDGFGMGKILDMLYKTTARPNIIKPTIVYEYPTTIVPLARPNDKDLSYNDMFQLVAGGTELVKAYQELNSPLTQLQKFIDQQKARDKGDDEAMRVNWSFIEKLIEGIPPCAGFGIGVDRLLSFLRNEEDIRNIIAYPL